MKLLLLHGSAIKASRIKLQELRSKFSPDNVMVFDKGEDLQTILTNLQSVSLFDDERLVILENPPEDFSFDPALITSNLSLVLWFDHEVAEKKAVLEYVKKNSGQIFYFPESKEISVFPFLDYLAVGDKKAFVELEKLKLAGFDIQYLITMIFYLMRNLVLTPKNAKEFMIQKLTRQRARFTKGDLINLYKKLLEIDFKIKSGLLEVSHAEFIMVKHFIG